jgi:hypothetical protein
MPEERFDVWLNCRKVVLMLFESTQSGSGYSSNHLWF